MTDESKILGPTAPIDLITLLQRVKSDVLTTMCCVQIGTIQSYDNVKNSAQVTVNFKRKYATGEIIDYPVLGDCPVFVLGGGGAQISMPIAKGDECIVLFNDRNIDNWWLSGRVEPPSDTRCHSIADGIVIVGIRSLISAKFTPANSVCINAGSKKVAIKNSTSGANIKTLIEGLIDQVKAITTTGSATNQSVSPASQTLLDAQKLEFAKLFDEGST